MLASHPRLGLHLSLAALIALCTACSSNDPLAAECKALNSRNASVELELVGYHPDGGACPSIGPFAIPEDIGSIDGGSVACGNGCSCTLGDYKTGANAEVHGVFGNQGTYTTCEGSFTRTCSAAASCTMSAPVISETDGGGYAVVSVDGCYLPDPNTADPVDSYGEVIETYGCTYLFGEANLP